MFKEFFEKGYIICENVFSNDELDQCRKEILDYLQSNKLMKNASGISIPDFINSHSVLKNTIILKESIKIHEKLKEIFNGDNYHFCSHNDIGINRIVGWHKDKLNGKYEKYEKHNIWKDIDNEKYGIVKVLIYLQDHENNNDALQLVPNSHLVKDINSNDSIYLHPKKGDVVIFDQRITHRGMNKQCNDKRILVSFGFGKNNIFTDEFEKGTIKRQNDQNY